MCVLLKISRTGLTVVTLTRVTLPAEQLLPVGTARGTHTASDCRQTNMVSISSRRVLRTWYLFFQKKKKESAHLASVGRLIKQGSSHVEEILDTYDR